MKKQIISLMSSLLLINVLPLPIQAEERNAEFDAFLDEQFKGLLEDDYVTMHFKVKDYASYGLEKPEVTFGTINLEEEQDYQEALDTLNSFDVSTLSATQYQDYLVLKDSYEETIDQEVYSNYTWFFTPTQNLLQNISQNMVEFPFYGKEDYYDYVTLLSTSVDYVEQALQITIQQVEQGYFMNSLELEETLDEIQQMIDSKENNPMVIDYEEDVDSTNVLTDGEKVDLKTQVKDYVENSFIPECQKVYDTLSSYSNICSSGSDYTSEEGKEYYTLQLQATSSTTKTVEEQFDDLDQFVQEQIEDLIKYSNYSDGNISMSDSNEILEYLKEKTEASSLKQISGYTFTVDYIDPSVVSGNTAAYYLIPRIDDWQENVIKVNQDCISNNIDLYSTLAHEGMPGHMYQNVYYYSTDPHPIRSLLSYTGYTEGWAQFAELLAYDYDILSEQEAGYYKTNQKLSYGLIGLIAIGVNYKGWSMTDVAQYIESIGLVSTNAEYYYELVLKYPYVYNSYAYGMARICEMEEEVKESLGKNYSLTEFVDLLLVDGPRSFDAIEEQISEYITSNKQEDSNNWIFGVAGIVILVTGMVIITISHYRKKNEHYAA